MGKSIFIVRNHKNMSILGCYDTAEKAYESLHQADNKIIDKVSFQEMVRKLKDTGYCDIGIQYVSHFFIK